MAVGRRDVGKGSPLPRPNHDLRNSGEGEAAIPDFQGYLKAVWSWLFYYLCQSSALDNSLASTLILKFEYFRIKKTKNSLSPWLEAGGTNSSPVPFWNPSWRSGQSYPHGFETAHICLSAHMLKQPNLTM